MRDTVSRLVLLIPWLLLSCAHLPPTCGQDAAAEAGPEFREQTIYVPYEKLRDVFEREGRGVFLPYEQFQQLWEAARPEKQHLAEELPVDSIITAINSLASVQSDVVRVEAELTIELLKSGWHRVPLRLSDSAIQTATINDEPARIVPDEQGNYELLFRNPGEEASQVNLKLTYVKAIAKSPGLNQVAFEAPRAPLNRWTIRIPQPGVEVTMNPMIAATDGSTQDDSSAADSSAADSSAADSSEDLQGETVLLAFVGSANSVEIRWTPQAEGAAGLTALTNVQVEEEVFIGEGTLRTRARLAYSVSRAPLSRLEIDVPGDHKVVNVFDPNIRKWEVRSDAESGQQRITIELFEPVSAHQNVSIELEKLSVADAAEEVDVPRVQAVGVGRQQGTVAVNVASTLRSEVRLRQGLQQLDVAELPRSLAAGSWSFAFRYSSLPYALSIAVEKLEPKISVLQQVTAAVQHDVLRLDAEIRYSIEQAGIFQVELDIPPDFDVVAVRGSTAGNATAMAVDTYYAEPEDPSRLIINLSRKAQGISGLYLRLERRLNDPNLQSPTGQSSTLNIPIPQADQQFIEQFDGRLVVYAPESLRLNPSITNGLRVTAVNDTLLAAVNASPPEDMRPVLGFAYNQEDKQLDVSVQRRSPYVTVAQIMTVRIEPGVVKYRTKLLFDVLYSGVSAFRIDVPVASASSIQIVEGSLRDVEMTPVPDDVNPDYVAWSLFGEAELIGQHSVTLSWELETAELPVGQSAEVAVPRIIPMEVDRGWGQIVVSKAESLDVQALPDSQGLRPIDPNHDVLPAARVGDAAMAFEFYADWTLNLAATRYDLQEVKRTSIERGLVTAVVTRSEQRSFRAVYRLRSSLQRLAIQLPAEAEFASQPARINGRPVALERGNQDQLYVPLVGTEPNTEVLLDLRYSLPGSYQQIDLPVFPDVPAVQKVYLAVYLPEDLLLLHYSGPWNDEFEWKSAPAFRWLPDNKQDVDSITEWVATGIQMPSVPAFQAAGTAYVFSTLRPAPPPEGSLQLECLHENYLSGLLIAGLLLIGLLLIRASLAAKLAAVATVLIVAVACGVFAPILGRQLLNLPAIAGLAMVGIAWSAQSLWRGAQLLQAAFLHRANSNHPSDAQEEKEQSTASALPEPESSDAAHDEHQQDGEQGGQHNA